MDAVGHAVSELPTKTLQFLLASRYCETDLLSPTAHDLFGGNCVGLAAGAGDLRVGACCPISTLGSTLRVDPKVSTQKRPSSWSAITTDLTQRLAVLLDLGLGYLTLEPTTPTLSPGELQRLRLATQVYSNLFGVVYVLDEPDPICQIRTRLPGRRCAPSFLVYGFLSAPTSSRRSRSN